MSLDDRLREIAPNVDAGQWERVKQAFADEGYRPYSIYTKVTTQDGETTIENGLQVMTGRDWYDRFEKELYKPKPQMLPVNADDDGESHDRFFRAGGANFMYNKALEAARKAAGIKEAI